MLDPRVVLIVAAFAVAIWAGEQAVTGVKKIGHGIAHVAHKIVHPHDHDGEASQ